MSTLCIGPIQTTQLFAICFCDSYNPGTALSCYFFLLYHVFLAFSQYAFLFKILIIMWLWNSSGYLITLQFWLCPHFIKLNETIEWLLVGAYAYSYLIIFSTTIFVKYNQCKYFSYLPLYFSTISMRAAIFPKNQWALVVGFWKLIEWSYLCTLNKWSMYSNHKLTSLRLDFRVLN